MTPETSPEVLYAQSVVSALIKDPSQLAIERTVDEKGVLLSLKVAKTDMGRLIGKKGGTIQAVRTLVQAFGAGADMHVSIKVLEPDA